MSNAEFRTVTMTDTFKANTGTLAPATPKVVEAESAIVKKEVEKTSDSVTTESNKPKDAAKEMKADGKSKGKEGKKDKDASKVKDASKPKEIKAVAPLVPCLIPYVAPTEPATLPSDTNLSTTELLGSLRTILTAAVQKAFPQVISEEFGVGIITRCGNPTFGDFQCNNSLSIAKYFKTLSGFTGPTSPKDIATAIAFCIPANSLLASHSVAPNGFINIFIATSALVLTMQSLFTDGVKGPKTVKRKVLVDFSSPNIAKEMHVGHLRSTIIGDAICRILEFCEHDVLRVNHVGDWGTQFGMLISYLQEEFPTILESPPNISDLTAIYKASKKRFDEDPVFKEKSRLNVVKLQSGDPDCRAVWTLLCDISRAEFQKVYDALGVIVEEVGESFYNPYIPATITRLQEAGLVEVEEGMLIIKLPHFVIPLIVRKSDGGYGYDSTDMSAIEYRLETLNRDWVIAVTDAGQATHFHMIFDTARAAGWVKDQRLDHVGFGVVCGEDGKRFKTRSSETVKLIDLLDAAKDRMRDSLKARADEGKCPLQGEELESAAKIIGYGAVKYFDLKQHPSTNYIFNYDRMLDTKGDTAVYLMFAFARVASILRKANEERNIDVLSLSQRKEIMTVDHPSERALVFELMQMGDVIKSVLTDLLPNRLCDYLKEISVKFTDFVTKCHVLNVEENLMNSRLLICLATKMMMKKCFDLLGIDTLERI